MRDLTTSATKVASILIFCLVSCRPGQQEAESVTIQAAPEVQSPSGPIEELPTKCADQALCAPFRKSEEICRIQKSEQACRDFVLNFEKLARVTDCKRRSDTQPVPSVWMCDEDEEESSFPKLFERAAKTLANAKQFDFARKFYGSEAFRSTLDGSVAQDHREESLKTGGKP